jgi:Fic family protein
VAPAQTPDFTRKLVSLWSDQSRNRDVSPLIIMVAFNLDFLCIHPFRDGNGRVSRLLLLLTAYHMGIEVGRYISLERLIEENKERYYETLQQSSQGWQEGKHDPWPYIGYLLFIIKKAYDEFTARAGELAAPRGEKSEIVMAAIQRKTGGFALAEIEKECPGVGRDWIRAILFQLKKDGKITCSGKGKAARWKRAGE